MTSAVAAILWVLAATVTAMLPYRRQFPPGITLLALAPVLIVWIGVEHGWFWVIPALLAFLSMFRNPLIYMAKRSLGRPVQRPVDPREGRQ
jgi:membrane-bound metal-dependent hydrolase YbcI (DUF457 family)